MTFCTPSGCSLGHELLSPRAPFGETALGSNRFRPESRSDQIGVKLFRLLAALTTESRLWQVRADGWRKYESNSSKRTMSQ